MQNQCSQLQWLEAGWGSKKLKWHLKINAWVTSSPSDPYFLKHWSFVSQLKWMAFVLLELTHMYICWFSEGNSSSWGIGNRFSRENICLAAMLASAVLGVLKKITLSWWLRDQNSVSRHGTKDRQSTYLLHCSCTIGSNSQRSGSPLAVPGTEHSEMAWIPGSLLEAELT